MAKLMPPKSPNFPLRQRLLGRLDDCKRHALIWIAGPAGAGKTTLVASHLRNPTKRLLWYRVDSADSDLATFFYYLRHGAIGIGSRAAARLPLFTPEYLGDLAGFSRRFFADLYAVVRPSTALVFDGIEQADSPMLTSVLREALAVLPDDIKLYVTSRNEPPEELWSAQLRGEMAVLSWADLQLTPAEAVEMTAAADLSGETLAAALRTQCDGWVAGMLLLIEMIKRGGAARASGSDSAQNTLFSYFAREVFTRASPSEQHVLIATALMPRFTLEQASALVSAEGTRQLLSDMCRRHYFIERCAAPSAAFQYHALFRTFLLEYGRSTLDPVERRELLAKAARLLESDRQADVAFSLYAEAENWTEAVRCLSEQALILVSQGRQRTLDGWLVALPAAVVDAEPWLLFWRGIARLPFDAPAGQLDLQRAYEQFTSRGVHQGRIMACAAMLRSFVLDWRELQPSDRWIEELHALLTQSAPAIPAELEIEVLGGFVGCLMRHMGHPAVRHAVERVWVLRSGIPNTERRVSAMMLPFFYFAYSGEYSRARIIFRELEGLPTELECSSLTLLVLESVKAMYAHVDFRIADYAKNVAQFDSLSRLSETLALPGFKLAALGQGVYQALKAGDNRRAESIVGAMEKALDPTRSLDVGHFNYLQSILAYVNGDMPAAYELARESRRHSVDCGASVPMVFTNIMLAQIYWQLLRPDDALHEAEQGITQAHAVCSPMLEFNCLLLKSYFVLQSGHAEAGVQLLRHAMTFGREHEQGSPSPWCDRRIAQRLCEVALRHGIETEWVREIIFRNGLESGDPTLESWPWPVHVYALGPLAVKRNGELVNFSGKSQKKPLALLHALLAEGGRPVEPAELMRVVWPNERSAARAAFDVALLRLRRLLGAPDAIILANGRMTLNSRICWVDAWAFERAATVDANRKDATGVATSLDLYRGHFLENSEPNSSIALARDRLASIYQRCVLTYGKAEEAMGRWSQASEIYRRGLERDNLAEEIYRRLMVCESQLGNHGEVKRIYQRCRDLLSIVLGAKPSAETESVYRRSFTT